MESLFRFRKIRGFIGLMLALTGLVVSGAGQENARLLFEQDLQSHGYKFLQEKNDPINYRFTELVFLSEDALLVAVKEISTADLGAKSPPPPVWDRSGSMPPTPMLTLFVFSVDLNRPMRRVRIPDRRMEHSVWPAGPGRFLLLTGFGLQLCSSDLKCGPPRPNGGSISVSARGTRIAAGGPGWNQQQLLDAGTFFVIDTFKRSPKIIAGDVGWLAQRYPTARFQGPDREEVDLGVEGSYISPQARFLDDDKVIGIRSTSGVHHKKAAVVRVDGTILYEIPVKAATDDVSFVTSVSGSRFAIAERQRLNPVLNFFDITGDREYDHVQILVFEAATGRQVFELKWDPRHYFGSDILPALSPDGHRLAVVRKGKLLVYDVP